MALAGLEREQNDAFAATAEGLKRSWPVAAFVLRNPGTSPSSLRAFHARVALPHYVLLTNVRRDPHGPMPSNPALTARDLVRSVTPGATLVSGETDPALQATPRRECARLGRPFVDAAPARMDVPGAEAISILDALLMHRFGAGLQAPEEDVL